MPFHNQALFRAAFALQSIVFLASVISPSHSWTVSSPLGSSSIGSRSIYHRGRISSSTILASSNDDSSEGESEVPFATIVGNGRIGDALAKAGNCAVLGRGDSIDADGTGPILLCTRNDALAGIIEKCPENRKKDLVFLQNGYLDDFLEQTGLSKNTQVLLYLSVPAKGVPPTDGVTAYNPEGLTAATGEWAQAFADRLEALDLKCNILSPADYRPAMFEKLMWISVYMLVGAANGCQTVGDAAKDHPQQIEDVIIELIAGVMLQENLEFPKGILERLGAYTDVVADFPCGVKEFEWRNQYFWNLGNNAVPIHNGLLKDCQAGGILSFKLPKDSNLPTK